MDITFNTDPLAYFWKGDVEKLMGKGKPLEQPMGFKLPASGTPPYVPQGNRWKQSAAKSSAASAGSFIGQRTTPQMIPKGGVTTNEPLAEKPPTPRIPQAIAPVLAPREGIAFGDLDPVQQPTTPTSPFDARREAVAAPSTPQLPQPLTPTPTYNPDEVPEVPTTTTETRRGNKIPPTPKAKLNPIRSPPENPRTSASPGDHSDDDAWPHSNNCPYRRVKCVFWNGAVDEFLGKDVTQAEPKIK